MDAYYLFNRVNGLESVLRNVKDVLPERELATRQKLELHGITDECRNVLDTLNRKLDKYHELDSNPKGIRAKSRIVWERLNWETDDIKELRSRITSNITLLHTFYAR
jgi:hypothetical protein